MASMPPAITNVTITRSVPFITAARERRISSERPTQRSTKPPSLRSHPAVPSSAATTGTSAPSRSDAVAPPGARLEHPEDHRHAGAVVDDAHREASAPLPPGRLRQPRRRHAQVLEFRRRQPETAPGEPVREVDSGRDPRIHDAEFPTGPVRRLEPEREDTPRLAIPRTALPLRTLRMVDREQSRRRSHQQHHRQRLGLARHQAARQHPAHPNLNVMSLSLAPALQPVVTCATVTGAPFAVPPLNWIDTSPVRARV